MLWGFSSVVIEPLGFVDVGYMTEGRKFLLLFYVPDIIDLPILDEHASDLLNLVKRIDIIA